MSTYFPKRKAYHLRLNKIVMTGTGTYPTYSYTNITERLQWLKAARLQFKELGYIATSVQNITYDKKPIIEAINRRINQRLNYQQWNPTNKKVISLTRALEFLISDGEEWKSIERYYNQVIEHYERSPNKELDLTPFSNPYLIAFNRIYKRGY